MILAKIEHFFKSKYKKISEIFKPVIAKAASPVTESSAPAGPSPDHVTCQLATHHIPPKPSQCLDPTASPCSPTPNTLPTPESSKPAEPSPSHVSCQATLPTHNHHLVTAGEEDPTVECECSPTKSQPTPNPSLVTDPTSDPLSNPEWRGCAGCLGVIAPTTLFTFTEIFSQTRSGSPDLAQDSNHTVLTNPNNPFLPNLARNMVLLQDEMTAEVSAKGI